MIHKRPYVEEVFNEVACKHPRQWEHTSHLDQLVNGVPSYHAQRNLLISDGEGQDTFSKCQYENCASRCVPHFLWVNSSIVGADAESEAALHLSLFPEYFAPGHQIRNLFQSDETCSSLLDCSPQNLVSIGPEHQADVPEWSQEGLQSSSSHLETLDCQVAIAQPSKTRITVAEDYGQKLMGTCIISMPDVEAPDNYSCVGQGKGTDCECLDLGSVRCIRQHVKEAREKLRENLGSGIFEELGFCDMGEEVAKKWTEEEEHAFHDIVLTNPLSLGKNFWDHLPTIFPSRTKRDLVSYYFNVYMLRKRAEQNRFDPVNIDSDDDEWQSPEHGLTEEDYDSVVESPPDEVASVYYKDNQVEDCHEDIEDDMDSYEGIANVASRSATNEEDEGEIDDICGPNVENFSGNYSDYGEFQVLGKSQKSDVVDYYIQDDSCTSYEYQREKPDFYDPTEMGTDVGQPSQE